MVPPAEDEARKPVYYADYLRLDELLAAQRPESERLGKSAHDEMLFIVVHQVHELWFKQILHEIESIIGMFEQEPVDELSIPVAVSRTGRITAIQALTIESLLVLETMTSLDFLDFRDFLNPASGFQSYQFRLIENRLGLRMDRRLDYAGARYFKTLNEEHQNLVRTTEEEPSLLDHLERWLERTPFLEYERFDFLDAYRQAVKRMLASDAHIIETNPNMTDAEREAQLAELEKTRESFESLFHKDRHDALVAKGERKLSYRATLAALFIQLYRDEPILHMPFRLLENLLDIDENFTMWRSRHALLVHRMIGRKIGTGGSAGTTYLQKVADSHKVFTDFFDLSTYLIPRSALPELPPHVKRELGFYFSGEGKTLKEAK